MRNQHHYHGGGKTGGGSSHRTTEHSGKRYNRGGKGSKIRRKKAREGKTLEYRRMQDQRDGEACRALDEALTILRNSEAARKCEQCEECEQESVRKHEKDTHPSTLKLPPPNKTNSAPERTTILTTRLDETVVNTTIFDLLRQQLVTDNGIESNILKEVFEQEITYEQSNFQEVVSDVDTEEIEDLERKWNYRYYKPNPDNNKQKFHDLEREPVKNKYGFSQDNIYLVNVYNNEREQSDLIDVEREAEIARQEATALFNENQKIARQQERDKQNKVVPLVQLTGKQKRENEIFKDEYKDRYFKKRKHK